MGYRRYSHDALVAMLVTVRNPNSSRYARAALLQGLWAKIDTQRAGLCNSWYTTPAPAHRRVPFKVSEPCYTRVSG